MSIRQKLSPSTEAFGGAKAAGVATVAAEKDEKVESGEEWRGERRGGSGLETVASVWYRCLALCFGLALHTT